jgi:lipoyl(octanoyl) transferase
MPRPLDWQIFEAEPYETIYARQKSLVEARIKGGIPDTLLLGEHPNVITIGRGTHVENLLATQEIPVVEIERGGDVTYHGPGQRVGYPILQLEDGERDLHRYLRNLEEVLIRVLRYYDLEGRRNPGWTGVWVGDHKIASIGVAVRKWVTYHGFALNVSTDLSYFQRINPCGLPATVMTSLAVLQPDTDFLNLNEWILSEMETVFDRSVETYAQTTIAVTG